MAKKKVPADITEDFDSLRRKMREMEMLKKRLADREKEVNEQLKQLRRKQRKAQLHVRVDDVLLSHIREIVDKEGLTLGSAVEKSFELFIERYKVTSALNK